MVSDERAFDVGRSQQPRIRPRSIGWGTWLLPLSALSSSVLGTSSLSELFSLGYAVPDHSAAPHIFLVLHNAHVKPVAGQSLVAGADAPPDPDVERLIPRLGAALATLSGEVLALSVASAVPVPS